MSASEMQEGVLLLVRLGEEGGGRVDPARVLDRSARSDSRQAFLIAQDNGWLDGEGYVTAEGRRALAEWDASP